jgi:5-methylcytosine-specific restriction protein A
MVDWAYDELVLVGDAVRANDWKGIRAHSADAKALAALLSQGKLHPGVSLPPDFRTPNSIQRKSFDLVTVGRDYEGVPTRGGKLAAVVMGEFEADPGGMEAKAGAIRELLQSGADLAPPSGPDDEPDEQIAAHEGGVIEVLAKRRERDRTLRKKKIQAVEKAGGLIACEACGFDFETAYGERGAGYIEIHHVNPLHVTGPTSTSLDDLALVCANCHRMCHRGKWITPAQVADLLAAQG